MTGLSWPHGLEWVTFCASRRRFGNAPISPTTGPTVCPTAGPTVGPTVGTTAGLQAGAHLPTGASERAFAAAAVQMKAKRPLFCAAPCPPARMRTAWPTARAMGASEGSLGVRSGSTLGPLGVRSAGGYPAGSSTTAPMGTELFLTQAGIDVVKDRKPVTGCMGLGAVASRAAKLARYLQRTADRCVSRGAADSTGMGMGIGRKRWGGSRRRVGEG